MATCKFTGCGPVDAVSRAFPEGSKVAVELCPKHKREFVKSGRDPALVRLSSTPVVAQIPPLVAGVVHSTGIFIPQPPYTNTDLYYCKDCNVNHRVCWIPVFDVRIKIFVKVTISCISKALYENGIYEYRLDAGSYHPNLMLRDQSGVQVFYIS